MLTKFKFTEFFLVLKFTMIITNLYDMKIVITILKLNPKLHEILS